MRTVRTSTGATVSYEKYGSGPPLVLVHGSFSDHATNWEFVKPLLEKHFSLYALARRGRGETDATVGHAVDDEALDVATLVEAVGEPVFLLGHSYGAVTAIAAAAMIPRLVRKLVLYEPARPDLLRGELFARLEGLAAADDWERFAITFFHDGLSVPMSELDELRCTELWLPILADAGASLQDLRALRRYEFRPGRLRTLGMPVMLQIGAESPRHLYMTDTLAAVLPDCRIETLSGQAHEGMTTAPAMYAESVIRFLLEEVGADDGANAHGMRAGFVARFEPPERTLLDAQVAAVAQDS
jgi:pimeloyl-ACP methyl ester carboxylesterase